MCEIIQGCTIKKKHKNHKNLVKILKLDAQKQYLPVSVNLAQNMYPLSEDDTAPLSNHFLTLRDNVLISSSGVGTSINLKRRPMRYHERSGNDYRRWGVVAQNLHCCENLKTRL
jgi:hypothetical protein